MHEHQQHFATLTDPRRDQTKAHGLLDLVAITLCAVIRGADGWVDVATFGRMKQTWLRTFLALPGGIPSHDTFGRVCALLDPDEFRRCFLSWATVFGTIFIVQGLVWLWVGVVHPRISFAAGRDVPSVLGGLLVLYAMVVYPIVCALLGDGYPQSPVFGVAPCPTTIFTFGLLLWSKPPVPKYVLVIPLIWAMIGFGAALTLGILEDVGLPIAAVVSTALLIWHDARISRSGGLRQRYA